MKIATEAIEEMVHRETRAWGTKDVELLLSLFHPDMVWVWPKENTAYNPLDWELPLGKFNYPRWQKVYQAMFTENEIIRNERSIVKITISPEGDGAFAVVDVDTVWKGKNGEVNRWVGRAGKTYTRVNGEWKLIAHFGLLKF